MKARDLYGLALRLAGLLFLVYAIFDLMHLVALLVGAPLPTIYPAATLAIAIGVWIVFGLALTFGANLITSLAYGADP